MWNSAWLSHVNNNNFDFSYVVTAYYLTEVNTDSDEASIVEGIDIKLPPWNESKM